MYDEWKEFAAKKVRVLLDRGIEGFIEDVTHIKREVINDIHITKYKNNVSTILEVHDSKVLFTISTAAKSTDDEGKS